MDSILPHDTAGWRLCLAADLLRDTGATVAHQVDSSNAFVLSTAFARQFGHRAPNTDASTSGVVCAVEWRGFVVAVWRYAARGALGTPAATGCAAKGLSLNPTVGGSLREVAALVDLLP